MRNRASEDERIRFLTDESVEDILSEDRVEGVRLKDLKTGEEWTMECDGVLIDVGWQPNTSMFRGQIDLDERGYIISKTGVDTSVAGVYVGGDILDERYRQVVTACGSGCKAALEAERYIEGHRERS